MHRVDLAMKARPGRQPIGRNYISGGGVSTK